VISGPGPEHDALLAAVAGVEVDSAAAVGLAESSQVPLVTKNR